MQSRLIRRSGQPKHLSLAQAPHWLSIRLFRANFRATSYRCYVDSAFDTRPPLGSRLMFLIRHSFGLLVQEFLDTRPNAYVRRNKVQARRDW